MQLGFSTQRNRLVSTTYSGLHELPILEVRDLVAEAALEAVRRVLGPVAVEHLDMPAAGYALSAHAVDVT